MWKRYRVFLVLIFLAAGATVRGQTRELVWSDEFDAPDGSSFDPAKWSAEVGGSGWGNKEREYYTGRTGNVFIEDGNLVIRALRENPPGSTCWYGPCQYSSARLVTKGRFEQKYGRIEARIRVPSGKGLWPAFWMLGNNIDREGWPACGEIDIMENLGSDPSTVHGTAHGPGYSGGASPLHATFTLPDRQKFSDDFHTFAVEWEPGILRWYADDRLYETRTPVDLPDGSSWVFDHPFFLILNLAVGGAWPGDPDPAAAFPQEMRVDYVRVYSIPSPLPVIEQVARSAKNILVTGRNFDLEAMIMVDGAAVKTIHDPSRPGVLIGRKLYRQIAPGRTVKIQVRNSDGRLSNGISWTRPAG